MTRELMTVLGTNALVSAYGALTEQLSTAGRARCGRCGSEWRSTRYGLELCARSVGGACREIVCSGCRARRS